MFDNILGSIETMSRKLLLEENRQHEFNNDQYGTASIIEETEKLKSLKTTPIKTSYSFSDFHQGIAESW